MSPAWLSSSGSGCLSAICSPLPCDDRDGQIQGHAAFLLSRLLARLLERCARLEAASETFRIQLIACKRVKKDNIFCAGERGPSRIPLGQSPRKPVPGRGKGPGSGCANARLPGSPGSGASAGGGLCPAQTAPSSAEGRGAAQPAAPAHRPAPRSPLRRSAAPRFPGGRLCQARPGVLLLLLLTRYRFLSPLAYWGWTVLPVEEGSVGRRSPCAAEGGGRRPQGTCCSPGDCPRGTEPLRDSGGEGLRPCGVSVGAAALVVGLAGA